MEKRQEAEPAVREDGSVPVPRRVAARLGLAPGVRVRFELNELGEVVLRRAAETPGAALR